MTVVMTLLLSSIKFLKLSFKNIYSLACEPIYVNITKLFNRSLVARTQIFVQTLYFLNRSQIRPQNCLNLPKLEFLNRTFPFGLKALSSISNDFSFFFDKICCAWTLWLLNILINYLMIFCNNVIYMCFNALLFCFTQSNKKYFAEILLLIQNMKKEGYSMYIWLQSRRVNWR